MGGYQFDAPVFSLEKSRIKVSVFMRLSLKQALDIQLGSKYATHRGLDLTFNAFLK